MEEENKKKPGRPKKQQEVAPIAVQGIVANPANPDSVLEMVYCKPSIFSELLRLYKQYKVSEVDMSFDVGGIKMSSWDHIKKSKIHVTIDGARMNVYYCRRPMKVCITRVELEKILGSLNKNNSKITFISREADYRSVMYMIVHDDEYNSDESFEVDVSYKDDVPVDDGRVDDDSQYPLKFRFTSGYFKNRVDMTKKFSKTMIFQKRGLDPMQITFDKEHKVLGTGIFNSPEKINLYSTIAEGDLLNVSIPIDYIKPFASSNIGDFVQICVHKTDPISFMTQLDGAACTIKVFTDIRAFKPEDAVL